MPDTQDIQNITLPVKHVDSPGDLVDAVKQANSDQHPIIDYGAFHKGLGAAPPANGLLIQQTGGLVEHWAPDMTIRVDGGATLGQIDQWLRLHHQWLPLNAPAEMTIAEAIAHNVSGPLKHRFGSLRDLLLGLAYVNAKGEIITVGGRTVKNVAGYDVTKFMVGSLNEFGIICQATLRAYAIPKACRAMLVTDLPVRFFEDQLISLITSDADPDDVFGLREPGQSFSQIKWRFGYSGLPSAIEAQSDALETLLPAISSIETYEALAVNEAEEALTALPLDDDRQHRDSMFCMNQGAEIVFRLIVPPSKTCKIIDELIGSKEDRYHFDSTTIIIQPLEGVIILRDYGDADRVRSIFITLKKILAHEQHQIILQKKVDPGCKEYLSPIPTDHSTLQRLKKELDPAWLFNPGRYLLPAGN